MNIKSELRWLIFISLIGFFVYANSLGGDFVYDDNRQIVRNPLIQDFSLVGKALTSDVWAFKGDGNQTASNYWRPTFTAWQILNFQIFGLSPFGWHLFNVLLHIGVCLLAFLLLRRWNLPAILSFAITLIFAVHPVHVESIAWVSGSPDLLFALCFLASLWFAENFSDKNKKLDLLLSLGFYALALGAKEVAVLCFPIYFLIFSRNSDESETNKKTALINTFIFVLIAALYFFLRWKILGEISRPGEGAVGLGTALISIPAVFVFYLKQIFFPLSIAANYPLRPIESIGFLSFIVPLIISIAVFVLFYLLVRRSFVQKIGLALFILPLLPTFNISAFVPEQIVHDRYLYLPLLGFLMLIFPLFQELLSKYFKEKAELYLLILAIVLSLPLAFQTFLSNQMWNNELSLWSQTAKVDANSASNWLQLGVALSESGKTAESIEAFNKSLNIKPTANGYLGRGQIFIKNEQFDEAVQDLQKVTEMKDEDLNSYTLYQAYEALAVAFDRKKDLPKAESSLREARGQLPLYYAALTEKIAVILYRQNLKQDALNELEGARDRARTELLANSKMVFFRLGLLYAEAGKKEDARNALQEYLKLTDSLQDKATQNVRAQVAEALKKLK